MASAERVGKAMIAALVVLGFVAMAVDLWFVADQTPESIRQMIDEVMRSQ